MTFDTWLASLSSRSVTVVGMGVSNLPLIRLLAGHGVKVTACDKCPRERFDNPALLTELEGQGVTLHMGEDYLENLSGDYIFRSPGIRPDIPAFEQAKARGSIITSEMETFLEVCPCPVIAVTGSDGKTTTTTIIYKLLQAAGYTVHVGGNIGHPLLAETGSIAPTDRVVLELSSFQLMTMRRSPSVAVITNLSPNHLDWHTGMEEYVAAKENIFLWQNQDCKLVLNYDNDITRSLAPKAKGRVVWFARQTTPPSGVTLEGENIVVKGERTVLNTGDILLPGVHNWENYMAAIAAVDGLVDDETIRSFARTFGGVEHRIELCRELDGVRYYNDSIASSPTRTVAGLRSFSQKLILIAGGYDKHLDYTPLGPEIVAHVKALVLTGATAPKIRQAVEQAKGFDPEALHIYDGYDFAGAVAKAHEIAQPGDVVILSPASASFDQFKNFMVRGETFKRIVSEL